jgi:hypothetical protein
MDLRRGWRGLHPGVLVVELIVLIACAGLLALNLIGLIGLWQFSAVLSAGCLVWAIQEYLDWRAAVPATGRIDPRVRCALALLMSAMWAIGALKGFLTGS